ncbi:uncharacterized protein LOC118447188 [Vespa mandarinia]|uniref:uncharacterized protein LOC118447188 n=1 Tax=Vespa mandarinia TaxID=7446 RepID=UPI00161A6183|nr:uncharacterized protein LOC118447188 [Vespa mandarinia]XP_035734681.1 uncharacterized protein LOC118447188 [Vespa mandarinia]XP_035734682.1 uncharacterized protein LOC118447188 [Vespa mandarinia]
MDCFDDDIFEFSDKDEDASISKTTSHKEFNPIEEHLVKQLDSIQNRIDKAKNELEEMKETVRHISNNLLYKAVFGQDKNVDSDNDLYTVEGEPVLIEKHEEDKPCDFLVWKEQWQYVLFDKWILGVVLRNVSFQTLNELRFYALPKGISEIHGVVSAFWEEENDLWKRINLISSKRDNVVATLVLDPLDFNENTIIEIYGTISYENLDTELQIAIPVVTFTSHDILRGTYKLNYSEHPKYTVLALKSIFVETILELPYQFDSENFINLLRCLDAKKILKNVYCIENTECYAIIETLSANKITILAKTMSRLKLILRMIQEESSIPITRLEESGYVEEAAEALIEELEMYLGDLNLARIQRARIKSDLLIP